MTAIHENDDGPNENRNEPGIDRQFRSLAHRVGKSADPELKEFLSGVLRATEATLSDLNSMRERLNKAEAEADAAAAAAQKAKMEAEYGAARSDIRAAAHVAGAIDPSDIFPFININDVVIDSDGKSNAPELMIALKKAKPHLFGRVSTSAERLAPKPGSSIPRSAMEMTVGEYRAAKSKFIRR